MQLLERTSFLETLAQYGSDASQGNGRLVLISGESGMGKTVLIEAFQQRTANARWLWGACDGIRTPRPLGPLFDTGMQAGDELAELCRRDAIRDQMFAAFLAEAEAPASSPARELTPTHGRYSSCSRSATGPPGHHVGPAFLSVIPLRSDKNSKIFIRTKPWWLHRVDRFPGPHAPEAGMEDRLGSR